MAGPKKSVQQPIDRPLSRAYLRQFSGWSTAYPPGLSEPTSMRIMENVSITPDGAARVRPAIRSVLPLNEWLDTHHGVTIVGSMEPFFLVGGVKAQLFAVRETNQTVGFRAAVYDPAYGVYNIQTLPEVGFDFPDGYADVVFSSATTYVKYCQIDNKIFALSNAGEPIRIFWVGEEKYAKQVHEITEPDYNSGNKLILRHPDDAWIAGAQNTVPPAETKTTTTLVSSDATKNEYNFAYFLTFNNDIGESAPGMVSQIKVQRSYGMWNVDIADDSKSPDQLAAIIHEANTWNGAIAQGAISWNLYCLTWTDQDSVPPEGALIKVTPMTGKMPDGITDRTYQNSGWATHTPLLEAPGGSLPLPSNNPEVRKKSNSTIPSKASQGLVAGDRIILVNDKTEPAIIRWSSNQQGNYVNFSPSVGGGYKTLTSGNMYIPAVPKLWQNPQSTDTIAVLCNGVDGYSTSYYMAPATIQGGSQEQQIMGFEETTATPGTVSPYGCEVLNNALYHPLDWMLMKSTASNYNISHKTVTQLIQDQWVSLVNKHKIVSAQLDNKLFYLVNNPAGLELPAGCNGNEIWVCDTEFDNVWSRWLIPAVSLHKLDIKGRLHLAVLLPNTIAVMDENQMYDQSNSGNGITQHRPIPWKFETNTQGANRAHDAWSYLKQVQATIGNLHGTIRYGLRGQDHLGKHIDVPKIVRWIDDENPADLPLKSDIHDFLIINRHMQEWFFYAESVDDDTPSYCQINAVQYRYTPASVNIGTEFGSIETFEYGRDNVNYQNSLSDSGTPRPFVDTTRP